MSKTKLKSCPFCGGKAKLQECARELPFEEEMNTFFVYCSVCGCQPFHFSEANIYYKKDSEERKTRLTNEAIAAWNRRSYE